MNSIVPIDYVTAGRDFSGVTLKQLPSGHIQTPWFSFDVDRMSAPAMIGSRWHAIIEQSKRAFARVLEMDEDRAVYQGDVIVAQRRDDENLCYWWRLTTSRPQRLPERFRKPEKKTDPANAGAIEI